MDSLILTTVTAVALYRLWLTKMKSYHGDIEITPAIDGIPGIDRAGAAVLRVGREVVGNFLLAIFWFTCSARRRSNGEWEQKAENEGIVKLHFSLVDEENTKREWV